MNHLLPYVLLVGYIAMLALAFKYAAPLGDDEGED